MNLIKRFFSDTLLAFRNRYYSFIVREYIKYDLICFKQRFEEAIFSPEALELSKRIDALLCKETGLCKLRSWQDPYGKLTTPKGIELDNTISNAKSDEIESMLNVGERARSWNESTKVTPLTPEEKEAAAAALVAINGDTSLNTGLNLPVYTKSAVQAVLDVYARQEKV
jgi:hypothetical protein